MDVKPQSGMVLTASLVILATWAAAQTPVFDPHGDPVTGVLRLVTTPSTRGQCNQCHPSHGDPMIADPKLLFTTNDNGLCFECHQAKATNYPLQEIDRLPRTEPDAGYFEANLGGTRQAGLEFRGRWPGEAVYRDPSVTPDGRWYSPHAHDADMPRRDAAGEGMCLNCHDPHRADLQRDLLTEAYHGIAGHADLGAPTAYRLCLSCHGNDGPPSMDVSNRYIEDYYDSGLNGNFAGHQIRKNPRIALSWPAHVQIGDKLACYDCHNPHGSIGGNGVEPNAFLLSDQRQQWSGLQATLTDARQARAFCLGCHITSDGIPGSQVVQGIVMNTLSPQTAHESFDLQSCYGCHGSDYSGPTAHNVHNPSIESSVADPKGFDEPWRR